MCVYFGNLSWIYLRPVNCVPLYISVLWIVSRYISPPCELCPAIYLPPMNCVPLYICPLWIVSRCDDSSLPVSGASSKLEKHTNFTAEGGVVVAVVFVVTAPRCAMATSFTTFLDRTQLRIAVDRTPLDEWSARRRDLYLTTHNTHSRQTSMPPVGFEPTISAGERPQTYALDRAGTGTGKVGWWFYQYYYYYYYC